MRWLRTRASARSGSAKGSSPARRSWPPSGRSSVPSTCSNVLVPDPDGPVIAAVSPARSVRLTPASTGSVVVPSAKLLTRPRASTAAGAGGDAGARDDAAPGSAVPIPTPRHRRGILAEPFGKERRNAHRPRPALAENAAHRRQPAARHFALAAREGERVGHRRGALLRHADVDVEDVAQPR